MRYIWLFFYPKNRNIFKIRIGALVVKFNLPKPNDLQYEMKDQDCLLMVMKDETTGYGTRRAGKQLRTKVMNFIIQKPDYPIVIDWSGIPVISSSFADEFIGKTFLELGAITFSAKIRKRGMEELIKSLLDKAISQRLTQAKDNE